VTDHVEANRQTFSKAPLKGGVVRSQGTETSLRAATKVNVL